MLPLNRNTVLHTLIEHETLTIGDTGKEENLGFTANKEHLKIILDELTSEGYLTMLNGVIPSTYTVTDKGIEEGQRVAENQQA